MNVSFYLLDVGLPCHLIFCQFWLCEEAQCVYLRLHLGSPRVRIYIRIKAGVNTYMDTVLSLSKELWEKGKAHTHTQSLQGSGWRI